LTQQDVESAFLIVPVKKSLAFSMTTFFPNAATKIGLLPNDVPDPWHQSVAVFADCANNIDRMLDDLIQALLNNQK
jgi:protein-tyrosine-phosphatase